MDIPASAPWRDPAPLVRPEGWFLFVSWGQWRTARAQRFQDVQIRLNRTLGISFLKEKENPGWLGLGAATEEGQSLNCTVSPLGCRPVPPPPLAPSLNQNQGAASLNSLSS